MGRDLKIEGTEIKDCHLRKMGKYSIDDVTLRDVWKFEKDRSDRFAKNANVRDGVTCDDCATEHCKTRGCNFASNLALTCSKFVNKQQVEINV